MQSVVSALACLACAGHAFRKQHPAQIQSSPPRGIQTAMKAETLQALATFLLASNPSGSFNPSSGAAQHQPLLNSQRRSGHSMPIMKDHAKPWVIYETAPYRKFRSWTEAIGAKALVDVTIGESGGERGVGAGQDIQPGSQIFRVPKNMAFDVTDNTPCPKWFGEKAHWNSLKWDAKLASYVLFEKNKKEENMVSTWLDMLPRDYCVPCLKPKLLEGLDTLGFSALCKDVRKQRAEWDAAHKKMPNNPTAAEFDWAMATVRSRAFSGPYTGGSLQTTLQVWVACLTACITWAVIVGGAGAVESAWQTALTISIALLANDFLVGPKLSIMKRHTVCPWLDLLNHDPSCGGNQFTYEYFQDSFAMVTDSKGPTVKKGDQVYVSYGPRSNDELLQYYGFVLPDNPHDAYVFDQENFILWVNAALPSGLPEGALESLEREGFNNRAQKVTLNEKGADDIALRLARVLTHPKSAKDGGRQFLPESEEASMLRTLATVARSREAALAKSPLLAKGDKKGFEKVDEESRLLAAFVAEKRKVLQASARALDLEAKVEKTEMMMPV